MAATRTKRRPAKPRATRTARDIRPQPKRKAKPKAPAAPLVRTSERTSFNRCLWQWDQGYNNKLKPRIEAPALRFGTLVHAALEARYPKGIKRGPKPAETFERLYHEELKEAEEVWGFRDADGEWENALDIGVDMLEAFVEHYGRDEEWEVIASEMTFKVPVYTPEHPDGGFIGPRGERLPRKRVLFYYVGTMDGVLRNRMDGGVRINDWKTTKNDPETEAKSKGVLDEQATAYWTWGVDWLVYRKILKPKQLEALDGMLFTFLRKAKRDERPQDSEGRYLNKDGSVSQRQPPKMFHRELVYRADHDREQARERAVAQFFEMDQRRAGLLPIYKSPGTGFPDQQCKACAFFDMCELHEVGADWEGLRDGTMTEWEPYGAHEIEEEGKY